MKITYLVANYNNGQFIGDCIHSLKSQTNSNWLCIIADDKSSDNSIECVRPLLNDHIRLIKNEKNLGKTQTLRMLMAHVQTEIVGILDPDDALYPQATECILDTYAKHPGVGFVYSNYANFSEDMTTMLEKGLSARFKKTSITEGFVGAIRTFRRRCYHLTSGWDTDMLYAEDRDLVYKMEEVTRCFFIDEALYKYRQLQYSQSNDPRKKEIGYRNHVRACEAAMARRNVRGVEALQYRLAMLLNIPHDENPTRQYSAAAKRVFFTGGRFLVKILGGLVWLSHSKK